MATKEEQLNRILDGGIVAIVRTESSEGLMKIVEAIEKGGIKAIEVTMTTPGALEIIKAAAVQFRGEVVIGVGTVLDAETARAAILAGAEFVVSPITDEGVIKVAKRYSKVVMPGAFTATEVVRAWEMGADLVKIFPTSSVGPKYISDLKGPLPHIRMIPTGGVSLETAADFLKAGAAALAVGGNLVSKKAVAAGRYDDITETARKFVEIVQRARMT